MADLTTIYGALLTSTLQTLDASEAAYLQAEVKQLQALTGKAGGVSLDDVAKAYAAGWLPDYYGAAEVEIGGQMVASSAQQQILQAGGGVSLGPVQINASFSQQKNEGQQSNLSVNTKLVRQSRSGAVQNAFQALTGITAPSVPIPTGTAPSTPVTGKTP